MFWEKKPHHEISRAVFDALAKNRRYSSGDVLGYPGSFLDREVFPDAAFMGELPFLSCLRENPNHIGCHTLGESEPAFAGTRALELDVLRICAEEILDAAPGSYDGYVASGGTECNLEALWIQRNRARDELGLPSGAVAVVCSEDTHYSIAKGADLLGLRRIAIPVDPRTRRMREDALERAVRAAQADGARRFVVVLNMGTTMFGSIDDPGPVTRTLDALGADHRIHVDAAFGGFVHPFAVDGNELSFAHPRVDSITLDGHKMLQSPYGTGVFLVRKGLIEHVCTREAEYVRGRDYTLVGSRSGASAVALWMILHAYGSEGGRAFVRELVRRTDRLCSALDAQGVAHFRDPRSIVVALDAADVPRELAERWLLVPDTHADHPAWWKIVVMDHVSDAALDRFLAELAEARAR